MQATISPMTSKEAAPVWWAASLVLELPVSRELLDSLGELAPEPELLEVLELLLGLEEIPEESPELWLHSPEKATDTLAAWASQGLA
mmetsp:Transcript_85195/g.118343  ORF Transcript_85195/g.118343 Transcript_85195/m.118343 type:complete len:87 (-) Transcript_85195:40-300(-)